MSRSMKGAYTQTAAKKSPHYPSWYDMGCGAKQKPVRCHGQQIVTQRESAEDFRVVKAAHVSLMGVWFTR